MIPADEQAAALMALAYCVGQLADETERDALVRAVLYSITARRVDETTEGSNGNETYAGAVASQV